MSWRLKNSLAQRQQFLSIKIVNGFEHAERNRALKQTAIANAVLNFIYVYVTQKWVSHPTTSSYIVRGSNHDAPPLLSTLRTVQLALTAD